MDRSASTSAQKCDRAIIAGELISPIQNPGNELICAPNNGARKQIYEEYEAYVDSLGNAYNCFTAECRRIILRIVTRRAESRNARAFTCPESRLINAARTRNSCVLSRNVTPVTAREIRKRSRYVLAERIPMCVFTRLFLAIYSDRFPGFGKIHPQAHRRSFISRQKHCLHGVILSLLLRNVR